MRDKDLEAKFEEAGWSVVSAVIDVKGEKGLAIRISENLSEAWQSGDVIVFWESGEATVLPEEFELVKFDLWKGW